MKALAGGSWDVLVSRLCKLRSSSSRSFYDDLGSSSFEICVEGPAAAPAMMSSLVCIVLYCLFLSCVVLYCDKNMIFCGTGVAFAPEPCWVAFAPE